MSNEFGIKISGRVIRGKGYGKVLGFPTANLDRRNYAKQKLKIKLGIYAGVAEFKLNAKRYSLNAGIVIGPRDTLNLPKIEAHLLGFKGNLYGRKIELNLVKYLRPFKKYKNAEELKKQINKDIKLINAKLKILKSKVQIIS